jgi:hypothetical protein
MGKNKKSIEYYLEKITEMSDVIETSDIFVDANIEVNFTIEKEEYTHLINHFREVDRGNDNFTILIGDSKFNFTKKS